MQLSALKPVPTNLSGTLGLQISQIHVTQLGKKRGVMTHRSHGTGIFTYKNIMKINGFHVGKYTVRPMDGMGD